MSKRPYDDVDSSDRDSDSDDENKPAYDVFDMKDMSRELLRLSTPLMPVTLDDMAANLAAWTYTPESTPALVGLLAEAEELLRSTPNLPGFARDIIVAALDDSSRVTRGKNDELLAIERIPLRVFYQALVIWLDTWEWCEQYHRLLSTWATNAFVRAPPVVAYWRMLFRGVHVVDLGNRDNVLVALGYWLVRKQGLDTSPSGPLYFVARLAGIYGPVEAFDLLCGTDGSLRRYGLQPNGQRSMDWPIADVAYALEELRGKNLDIIMFVLQRAWHTTGKRLREIIDLAGSYAAPELVMTGDMQRRWSNELGQWLQHHPLLSETYEALFALKVEPRKRFMGWLWGHGAGPLTKQQWLNARDRFKMERVFAKALPLAQYLDDTNSIPKRPIPLRMFLDKFDALPRDVRLRIIQTELSTLPFFWNPIDRPISMWLPMAYSFGVAALPREEDPELMPNRFKVSARPRGEYPELAGACIVRAMEALISGRSKNEDNVYSPELRKKLVYVIFNEISPRCLPVEWHAEGGLLQDASKALSMALFTKHRDLEAYEELELLVHAMVELDERWSMNLVELPLRQRHQFYTEISPMRLALLTAVTNMKTLEWLRSFLPFVLLGFDNSETTLANALAHAPFVREPEPLADQGIVFSEPGPLAVARILTLLPFAASDLDDAEHRALRMACRTHIARVLERTRLPDAFMPLAIDRVQLRNVNLEIVQNGISVYYTLFLPATTTIEEMQRIADEVYRTEISSEGWNYRGILSNNDVENSDKIDSFPDDSTISYQK